MNNLTENQIRNEEDSNLIWICNSKTQFWNEGTKVLAKKEIRRRKIQPSEIKEFLKDFNNWSKETEKEWEQIYLETINNEENIEKTEFSLYEKILIIATAPFTIKWRGIGPSLFSLYRDKKMKMFWEKLILFALGILIWIGIINYSFELSEKKRMEEIEKIDISDWEKENGYD
jgi:hypothetical protein